VEYQVGENQMNNNRKMMWLLIVLACASLVVVIANTPFLRTIRIINVGFIKTFGVEVDVDFIDWEKIEPNETKPYVIHVRPNGTMPAVLSLDTGNWNPANASDYMMLSWNYTGAVLQPDVWVPVELNLFVSPDIKGIKKFSFDIIIIGSEAI